MFTDESEIVHGRIGGFREERGKEHVPQLGHNTPNGGDLFQYITILQVTPCFLIPGYNIYIRHLQNRTFDGFMHKKKIFGGRIRTRCGAYCILTESQRLFHQQSGSGLRKDEAGPLVEVMCFVFPSVL